MKFEPISFEHAAKLIGALPWDVSRNSDLLTAAQQRALEVYNSDRCFVGLDIYNIEIEAYGCTIIKPDDNGVPVAGEPIVENADRLLSLELNPSRDGRIPMILEAAEKLARKNPRVDIRIPISGPFTIGCHLLGMENMICELFTNAQSTEAALMHLADNQVRYAKAALEMGFSIALFESSVTPPLLSPRLFTDSVAPCLNRILEVCRSDSSRDTQLIIGGDTVLIAEEMCSLGASYIICPVETDQENFMSRISSEQGIHVRINMNPSVFRRGMQEDARAEAMRVLRIAERYANTSIGTLIPFDADSQLICEISELLETGQQRNAADA